MSQASAPAATIDALRHAFATALPRMDAAIARRFRRRPRDAREEACAEARAYTWSAWLGLARRGRDPLAVGVVAIAANCCRAVANGRSVTAVRPGGRGTMDVYHPRARTAGGGRVVVPLDESTDAEAGGWRDALTSGRRYGPADEAAFRVDFAAWLDVLPARLRRVAELLAEGLGTGDVAGRLGVTPGAISQARGRLALSWDDFQRSEARPDGV